jgi:DNA-directed RNA polymerase subunit RPC12/RpoP
MAAAAVIACPHCHKKFKGNESLKGKKIKCPKCARSFVVELVAVDKPGAPPRQEEAVKAAHDPQKSKAQTWDEEDEDSNPYAATTLDLTPRCPFCAGEMESEDAVVCLHCGYNTLTRSLGHTEKTIETTFGDHFRWLWPGIACAFTLVLIVVGYLYFCFQIPEVTKGHWTSFLDHESMRLWLCLMLLAGMWGIGMFVFKRLLIEPMPPEKVKD